MSRKIHKSGLLELKAAVSVAEHRSFRAAADALAMSPNALSSTVCTLEDRLGIRLFNRTTRSVSLTSAAEELIARVTPSLAEIERAMESAGSHSTEPGGILRINASVTAAHAIVPGILASYMRRYTAVQVELSTETRLIDVVLGGCDAGIRLAESVPPDMVAVPFPFSLDFRVVGSPEYLSENPAPKISAELMQHRCVRAKMPGGGFYRWEFEQDGQSISLDVPGCLTLDDQSLMLKAALDGLGLVYISKAIAHKAVAAGELRYALEDWMPQESPLCLYYPRNRNTSAALMALIHMIQKSV